MFDKYYTAEQQEYLEKRRQEVGEERILAAQAEWEALFAEAKAEMEKGTDPADAAVQKLVQRSGQLVAEFTGGDPGVHESLSRMWQQEPSVRQKWGPEPEVWEYLQNAAAANQSSE